jgi:manganese oxidase
MTFRTRRWVMPIAFLALVLVAAACSSDGGGEAGSSGSGSGEQAVATTTFEVTLSEFKIDPSVIDAPAGEALTFDVTNAGVVQHTFAVATDAKVYETSALDANGTATLAVDALDVGTYKIYCTVPGHEDSGMVGQLIVGQAAEEASGGTDQSGSSGGMSGMDMSGSATSSPAAGGTMTAQEMADGHKAGVEAFPAETEGTGNEPLKPKIENGVKVFHLTATELKWEVEPGKFVDAMAFNGQIPGPQIDVNQGDKVRIVLDNQMTQPTVLHFHGLTVPNAMDGVPYITQDPIMPGGFFTYEFTVQDPPGMYVYHSHFNSTEQVGKGLYGALYVEPKGGNWPYQTFDVDMATGAMKPTGPVKVDDEYTLFLGDGPLGFVLNGKSFPATQPIVAKQDDWVLIHIANDGAQIHPMHLHGYHFEVVAQDGYPLMNPYMADTLMVAPGQRFDILIHAVYPGVWAYHCHILPHVEGPGGMYGMVTALVVQ